MPRVRWSRSEKPPEKERVKKCNSVKGLQGTQKNAVLIEKGREALNQKHQIVTAAHEFGYDGDNAFDAFQYVIEQMSIINTKERKKIAKRAVKMCLEHTIIKKGDMGAGDMPENATKFVIHQTAQQDKMVNKFLGNMASVKNEQKKKPPTIIWQD